MELSEQILSDLSKIRVQYFVGPSRRFNFLRVLVVRFGGTYREGSGGNEDALYMCAMTQAGNTAFNPNALIYDLSGLSYQYGDALTELFSIGPKNNLGNWPVAAVVGPDSERSVRTLCVSEGDVGSAGFVFPDLEGAWSHVEERIISDEAMKFLTS